MQWLSKPIKIDNYLAVLILLVLIFFGIYSYLGFTAMELGDKIIFNSPDETANYWAAATFYSNGNFTEFSEASLQAGDIVSPRSLRIIDNYLVPTGFLGMPWLYGILARLFNCDLSILFFTPFFAALGALFFYLSLRFIFSRKASWLAAALVLVHPAWWYYATRSMMPNVLFLSLLMVGVYLFLSAIHKDKNILYIGAGIAIGLSLMVRAAEIIWVLPLFILLCLAYFKKINWTSMWLTPIVTLAAMLPMFYYNNILFGNPLSLGYQISPGVEMSNFNWLSYLLPFGFDLAIIKLHAAQYLRDIFHWYYLLIMGGLGLLVISFYKAPKKYLLRIISYTIVLNIIAVILLMYYGSWQFHDNPNPSAVTIGTSFVRYWLPIYIMALPLLAVPIARLFRKSTIAWALTSLAILIIAFSFSYRDVYKDKQEGVLAIQNTINSYQQMSALVRQSTEDNAVIIAKKSDKVFFPSRTVIYDLFYDIDYQRVYNLIGETPVYLWDWQHNQDIVAYLNNKDFHPLGLEIVPTNIQYNNMALYKFEYYEQSAD